MIYPDFLEKDDRIGITAPSAGNSKEMDIIRLDNGIDKLTKLGYPVVETMNVRMDEKGRSSSGKQRAEEFMSLLRHPKVKAIVSAKGGDYLCEMLSHLDFEEIKKYPKWVQGYSDNTGILFTLTTNCQIASIYGNNFNDFGMGCWHEAVINNFEILKGNLVEQESFSFYEDEFHDKVTGLESYFEDKEVYWTHNSEAKEVIVKGRMLGGCLDVLLNLVGTRYDKTKEFAEVYKEDGILWYLESFEADRAGMVRSLWQLKEAGWFDHASGFVFGRPCMYRSFDETPYEDAVMEVLGAINVPVIFNADIGHKGPQFAIINGALGTIWCSEGKGKLRQKL